MEKESKRLTKEENKIIESCKHGWQEKYAIDLLSSELKMDKNELKKVVDSLIKRKLLQRFHGFEDVYFLYAE
jgi:DNA-binding MarR family transcriptional regulator